MSGLYHPPPDASSPFRDRLLHPRRTAIEEALGRSVPGVLREVYGAPEALPRGHFYLSRPDGGAKARVGDPYFFVPDATEYGDGPVFLLDHQRGEPGREPVAASLAEFLRWPRQYRH